MSTRSLVAVAVRIVGAYYVIECVLSLASLVAIVFVDNLPDSDKWWYWASVTVHLLAVIVVATVLLRRSDAIAERIVGSDITLPINVQPATEESVFRFAVRIAGVYFAARGVPEILSALVEFVRRLPGFLSEFAPFAGYNWYQIPWGLGWVLIGLYAIRYADRVAAFAFRRTKIEDAPVE